MLGAPFFPIPLARRQLCPLCREAIGLTDDTVAIPDFLADESDPLWPYSDALYHRACFLLWDRRRELLGRFNTLARARSGDWHMAADGTLLLGATSGAGSPAFPLRLTGVQLH